MQNRNSEWASLPIAPISRLIALDRYGWVQGWTEANSKSYWLREAQAQAYLGKLATGKWVQ
jgi:hypothetical protein